MSLNQNETNFIPKKIKPGNDTIDFVVPLGVPFGPTFKITSVKQKVYYQGIDYTPLSGGQVQVFLHFYNEEITDVDIEVGYA